MAFCVSVELGSCSFRFSCSFHKSIHRCRCLGRSLGVLDSINTFILVPYFKLELISRKQALAEGLSHYFTGKPCKFGHIAPRNTGSSNCHECWRNSTKAKRDSDPEAYREYRRADYAQNKEAILAGQKRYRAANWAEIYARRKANPKYKEYMAQYAKTYFKSSLVVKAKALANCRRRQARKLQRTPAWVSKAEFAKIAELYTAASKLTQETGVPHVVDHIIPLNGALVCGLHCLSNLQILTQDQNRKKWNYYSVED